MARDMTRRIYTHHTLLAAANALLTQANQRAEFHNSMGCVLFCALAIEATLNHSGQGLFPDVWKEHLQRNLGPKDKLMLLEKHAAKSVDFGCKPFQSFDILFKLRNSLAHGVVENVAYGDAKHWIIYGEMKWPAAKWETVCNKGGAASLLKDTKEIIEFLYAIPGVEKIPSFVLSEHV